MYSWKIIHGKHKRIALKSLINMGIQYCQLCICENPDYPSQYVRLVEMFVKCLNFS